VKGKKPEIWVTQMKIGLLNWACETEAVEFKRETNEATPWSGRSLHPVAGEIAGHRLMHLLSIGTAPSVEIVSAEEARQRSPARWIVKILVGGRLKILRRDRPLERALIPDRSIAVDAIPEDGYAVMVEKIPRAIPIFYLRAFHDIKAEFPPAIAIDRRGADPDELVKEYLGQLRGIRIGENLRRFWNTPDDITESLAEMVLLGKDQMPGPQEFYSDFEPPSDWSAIKAAIAWDSSLALRIHAARAFLATSFAHSSNLLVDPEGQLYTVDFEYCNWTDGEDIRLLFENVARGTRAFQALRDVAELTEAQLCGLFEDLPSWIPWPLGSKERTISYYQARLNQWKSYFALL
jgi:hypothetical protein